MTKKLNISYHKLLRLILLIILLMAALGLGCFLCGLCLLAESGGYSLVAVCGFLIAVVLLVEDSRLSTRASVKS